MSMTRRDFKAIAEKIRYYHIQSPMDGKIAIRYLADDLCLHFKQANPTFDKGKFLRACGFYQEG